MRQNLVAIRHLEEAVIGARWTEGIVLRYGWFYGPGTSMAPGAEQLELVRRRKFPLVGDSGACVVVHSRRGRGVGNGGGDRARAPRGLQRGRR